MSCDVVVLLYVVYVLYIPVHSYDGRLTVVLLCIHTYVMYCDVVIVLNVVYTLYILLHSYDGRPTVVLCIPHKCQYFALYYTTMSYYILCVRDVVVYYV